jgi:DNA-binding MarR family transcriptional regulator
MKNQNELATCTCFNLRQAARAVTQVFDEALKPAGLRATQFSLLAVLSKINSATITQLSQFMVMDRTTLTRNLKPLESLGWVQIVPGEDRRQRTVSLTSKGQETLAKALPFWKKAQTFAVDRLSPARWQRLIKDLGQTVQAFDPD